MLAFVIPSFYFNGLPSALSYAVLVNYRYEYRFSFDGIATLLTLLLFGALWLILQGDLLYVLSCAILFLCCSVLLELRLPRLGKRELILVVFVRLIDLCLFGFVGFLFLLMSLKGCGL